MNSSLHEKLKHSIAYLPSGRYAIAVSGGSDSLALLYLCAEFSNSDFTVLHFNHNVRPEAKDEELMVKSHSEKLGFNFISKTWSNEDINNSKGNFYQSARNARYNFFKDIVKEHKLDGVLIAHSKTDLAETLLMRLGKGASVKGAAVLSAESESFGIKLFRPLLDYSRQDLKDYLASKNIVWASDPSNQDTNKMRPRIRKILPTLENLGISLDGIKSSIKYFNFANQALDYYVNLELVKFNKSNLGYFSISANEFFKLPTEVQIRLINKFIDIFDSSYQHKPRIKNVLMLLDRLKTNNTSKEHIDILSLEIINDVLFIYVNDKHHKQKEVDFDSSVNNLVKLQDISKKTRYNIIKKTNLQNMPVCLRNRVLLTLPKNKALKDANSSDFTCLVK